MRRIFSLIFLSAMLLSSAGLAQSASGQGAAQPSNNPATRGTLYDDFNRKWLDPARWQPMNPNCWGNVLECVREIRNGKLRLAARNFGATDSDSGIQYSESEVYFIDPNSVTSITADINVGFSGIGCATNDTDRTHTQVQIEGRFFNTGSGNPSDDMDASLIIWIDTIDPTTMQVSVYWGYPWPGLGTDVGFASYPVGTELTATLKWDKANHQLIGITKIKGEPEQNAQRVAIPYGWPDSTPPASPVKSLLAGQHTLNCTSAKTNGQVEATFDNVFVNR